MNAPLVELIDDGAILLDAEAADWTAAIRLAGGLLEETGATTAGYTQAMIDSVVENGPYIVIAPGLALPHARPSEDVRRTGISWVRLAAPVAFGSENHDPVSLVVALAARDSGEHLGAMAELAEILGDQDRRAALDAAATPAEVRRILQGDSAAPAEPAAPSSSAPSSASSSADERHLILTVCGNGLGTSLFLKNTLEETLGTWGWGRFVTVEATDTISARGRANEATAILTSGEIAKTLGDVGVPVRVVENFTSTDELDAALRELYDV